jgi:hypothetical protein
MVTTWKHVMLLFTFEQLVKGGTTTNMKATIFYVLIKFGGFAKSQILEHLMCVGVDGTSTCQGVRSRIIILMETEQTFYLVKIHCMAHKTNLVIQAYP